MIFLSCLLVSSFMDVRAVPVRVKSDDKARHAVGCD